MTDYYKTLKEHLKLGDVLRLTDLDSKKEGLYQEGKLIWGEEIASPSLIETIKPEPQLVIFGAGHISKAISDIAHIMAMRTTVLDEREKMLSEERFPHSERILMPYKRMFSTHFPFFRPYFIILTHGHAHDKDALRYCLSQSFSYIGMIGSKGKVISTLDELALEGIERQLLSSVHAPIGIKIGAQSPEEIAISIIAEVIGCYRKDKNMVNISPEYLMKASGKRGISVRIIEKKGSAPRQVGSEMLVMETGVYGTIGGGAIEKNAIETAQSLLKDDSVFEIRSHRLSSAGDLGMICGGDVTLLYQLRAPEKQ